MKIVLLDYQDNKREFEIGDLNDIATITMRVVSGDEIATVCRKDGKVEEYDSDIFDRRIDFDDGGYFVYSYANSGCLFNEKWLNRKSSYAWFHELAKEEKG